MISNHPLPERDQKRRKTNITVSADDSDDTESSQSTEETVEEIGSEDTIRLKDDWLKLKKSELQSIVKQLMNDLKIQKMGISKFNKSDLAAILYEYELCTQSAIKLPNELEKKLEQQKQSTGQKSSDSEKLKHWSDQPIELKPGENSVTDLERGFIWKENDIKKNTPKFVFLAFINDPLRILKARTNEKLREDGLKESNEEELLKFIMILF